jgi:hypothetical protein
MDNNKNRDILPIGTRVKPAYAKLSNISGIVERHSEDSKTMWIRWDNEEFAKCSSYLPSEVIEL